MGAVGVRVLVDLVPWIPDIWERVRAVPKTAMVSVLFRVVSVCPCAVRVVCIVRVVCVVYVVYVVCVVCVVCCVCWMSICPCRALSHAVCGLIFVPL